MDFDSYTTPDAEDLLRSAATRYRPGEHDHRELITEAAFGAVFLLAAAAVAWLAPSARPLTVIGLLVTVPAYIVANRVDFPVAAGWTRPTQVVFVPMLFVLPLPLVPLVVVVCNVLEMVPQLLRGTVSRTRVIARFGDAAFALGPVLVLIVAHEQRFGWTHWPLYVAAFAAQVGFDLASGLGRMWFAEGVRPSKQFQMAWIYATDACLTCAGLLVASSAEPRPGLVLLTLPLIALLGLFARERSERIENTLALSTAYRGTAQLLGDVIEDDDEYTGIHSRAVVDLSMGVADRLDLDPVAKRNVEFGALLHDVGKIRVPKEIIRKPGHLDPDEWAIVRQHTIFGEQMLRRVGGTLSSVGKVVRHSHERWDGTGYPDGLAGEQIPIEARIVSACDAFNAMTTHRSYRAALPQAEAEAELRRCSGTQFDPRVVSALLRELAEHPPLSLDSSPPLRAVAAGTVPAQTPTAVTSSASRSTVS